MPHLQITVDTLLKYLMVFFLMTTGCLACKSKYVVPEGPAAWRDPNCPEDLACTEEFKTITLTVTLSNNLPAVLDSFKTIIADTGNPLMFSYSKSNTVVNNHIYDVANDGNMAAVGREGKDVLFIGYLDGKKVVNHPMKIGHDCCHITLLAGETTLKLKIP